MPALHAKQDCQPLCVQPFSVSAGCPRGPDSRSPVVDDDIAIVLHHQERAVVARRPALPDGTVRSVVHHEVAIALHPEVVGAATVTGTADAILHVLARDMQHLETALEKIRSTAAVERTESIVVLSNLIDRSRP